MQVKLGELNLAWARKNRVEKTVGSIMTLLRKLFEEHEDSESDKLGYDYVYSI